MNKKHLHRDIKDKLIYAQKCFFALILQLSIAKFAKAQVELLKETKITSEDLCFYYVIYTTDVSDSIISV